MALMVKCKNPSYGFEYPSANQMDEIAFQVARLSNMSEECPHCNRFPLMINQITFLDNHLSLQQAIVQ
jgi:hypothetical protein